MVYAVYFTGTETTKKIVCRLAEQLDDKYIDVDFSLPKSREGSLSFHKDDLVILGLPVIAGRVPNLLLPFLNTLNGCGALAVPVVLYGNRSFDDALMELRDLMENRGFHTIAAAAFIGEHSFSRKLGKGRPDKEDMKIVARFAEQIKKQLCSGTNLREIPVEVEGSPMPYRDYYKPRDRHGRFIDIRKVKPKTSDNCKDCKLCAEICPMGSIDREYVKYVHGICMKCCACEKRCPVSAKYFDDPGYLYHKEELEAIYTDRQQPKIFL